MVTEAVHPADTTLIADAAAALAVPRTERNSFTLHAPLELLARAELLPIVEADAADRARARIGALADGYNRSGEAIPTPPPLVVDGRDGALATLSKALHGADPELADAAAGWLSEHLEAPEIARVLAGPLVLEMGAAGHAPILFASYLRDPGADTRPLRGVARRLAEHPDIRVPPEWLEPPDRPAGSVAELDRALSSLQIDDEPGWGIFTLVDLAHRRGIMAELPRVADDQIDEGFRVLFRVAARSMIEDDPTQAAYGWSHALTIPLGIRQTIHLHDRRREAFDVATILAAGFRGGHGAMALATETDPPPDALPAGVLATRASVEHDAHLVKYILACLHAAALDPGHDTLYRRAAQHLIEWWDTNPADDDPLA